MSEATAEAARTGTRGAARATRFGRDETREDAPAAAVAGTESTVGVDTGS